MSRLYYNREGTLSGMPVTVSGVTVEISGDVVQVSGQSIFVYISSGTVRANVSGDVVTVSGNWIDVSGATVLTSVSGNAVNISGSYVYPRETFVAYTSGLDLIVDTSATLIHTVTAPQPSYYEYTAIKIGASASISTDIITAYLTPAGAAAMSGTVITTATLDSGTYSMYMGIPAAIPYYPFALLSGDVVAINVPLVNYITGDMITVRTVLKTV